MKPFLIDVFRLGVWLALLAAIFVPLERLFALRRNQKTLRTGLGLDLAYYFLSSLLPKLVLVTPLTLLAGLAHGGNQGSGFYGWMAALPVWVKIPAALVVMETGSYWGHRWSHEIPFLWRFHKIHHGAEELDWLVSTRAHPVDLVFTRLCGMIPLYVLGLAQASGNQLDLTPMLLTVGGTIWGFLIHANVNWRLGWLEWLVSTPAFHHWHHDGVSIEGKNYSATFPWVDQLFGTFQLPGTWPLRYGIEKPLPQTPGEQILHPLAPQKSKAIEMTTAPR
jgi:sterol desaturase/sphingolipid hydroxylase (fatty acid hydroxylase superfamily)